MNEGYEERLSELEMEDNIRGKELSIVQKRALIKEAKVKYGNDWLRSLGERGVHSGMDWKALRFKVS